MSNDDYTQVRSTIFPTFSDLAEPIANAAELQGTPIVSPLVPTDQQVLLWDGTNQEWVAGSAAGALCDPQDNIIVGPSGVVSATANNNIYLGCGSGPLTFVNDNNVILGRNTSSTDDGDDRVSIGTSAGRTSQAASTVAIGLNAGSQAQGTNSVAVGSNAGRTSQAASNVAIGLNAGSQAQGTTSVAVGSNAGELLQGQRAVAVGNLAGNSGQRDQAVAIGTSAGSLDQQINAVAIGNGAGQQVQGLSAVAVGFNAGQTSQSQFCVAVGASAGAQGQSADCVAVGNAAGFTGQSSGAIAIGRSAGFTGQSSSAIAVGLNAGQTSQGQSCIAVGLSAGSQSQGSNAVAIGNFAGQTSQTAGSIALNATGAALAAPAAGFYVNPVRSVAAGAGINVLSYVTNEILENTDKTFVIQHPLNEDKYLVHACLEGPEAGVYYRGEGCVNNSGKTAIHLPSYVAAFATDFSVQISAIDNGQEKKPLLVSRVREGKFSVRGEVGTEFFWQVYGRRNSIEVEPNKSEVKLEGEGPYKYLKKM